MGDRRRGASPEASGIAALYPEAVAFSLGAVPTSSSGERDSPPGAGYSRAVRPSYEETRVVASKCVQLSLIDVRSVRVATTRLQVAIGRVLDAKEVMKDAPDIRLAMARLPLSHVQDDHPDWAISCLGRLHREGEPVPAPQVNPTDLRLERPGESVSAKIVSARISLELPVNFAVSRPPALECFDERPHSTRRNDLERGHAAKSGRYRGLNQSSGPKDLGGAAETRSPSARAASPGP